MMTELAPDLAPGCFGSAIACVPDNAECRSYPFASLCEPQSRETRAKPFERLGIAPKPEKPRVVRPRPERGAAMMGLPKKVEELLARIDRAGIKVTEALARGENPFTATPAFLRVTCHLLLRIPAGISRDDLRMALMTKLNWTHGTAAAHAVQAAQALVALGAAVEINGKLMLKR